MLRSRSWIASLFGAFLLVLLCACGGGGGGGNSANSDDPPLADNGGLWVGTWTSTAPAGYHGLIVVELHQSGSNLSGYATVTDSSLLNDQPCLGTVNGASIQFGVVGGQVDYTGTLAGTSASGTFYDTSTTVSGTWSIRRYMGPFDNSVTPIADLTGTWTSESLSTQTGTNPPKTTLNLIQTDHTLDGLITPEVGSAYPILAGYIAGGKAWYAAEPAPDTLVVVYGDVTADTGSGGWVQYGAGAASNPQDQGTWTATKP